MILFLSILGPFIFSSYLAIKSFNLSLHISTVAATRPTHSVNTAITPNIPAKIPKFSYCCEIIARTKQITMKLISNPAPRPYALINNSIKTLSILRIKQTGNAKIFNPNLPIIIRLLSFCHCILWHIMIYLCPIISAYRTRRIEQCS